VPDLASMSPPSSLLSVFPMTAEVNRLRENRRQLFFYSLHINYGITMFSSTLYTLIRALLCFLLLFIH
jgi:hypothetical protein